MEEQATKCRRSVRVERARFSGIEGGREVLKALAPESKKKEGAGARAYVRSGFIPGVFIKHRSSGTCSGTCFGQEEEKQTEQG